jgi:hypothetical protein
MRTVVGARAEVMVRGRHDEDEHNHHGRHRLGRPGLAHRRDLVAARKRRRAQHRRRASRRGVTAEGLSLLVAMIAVVAIAVSGWYAASGASAVVQMLAR